ncbi:hypothetical protein EYF80_040927 [Liparis tanakae]|uniref:Uncharacterized protein n=1 Tax=Liparis tanakae TaxID=230148 RepID=A0A4Z2G6H7_9TELE|nr:hypothetical protein EYF80_040927 [Liparis tanakae]
MMRPISCSGVSAGGWGSLSDEPTAGPAGALGPLARPSEDRRDDMLRSIVHERAESRNGRNIKKH